MNKKEEISVISKSRQVLVIFVTIGLIMHSMLLLTVINRYIEMINTNMEEHYIKNDSGFITCILILVLLTMIDIVLLVFRKKLPSMAIGLLVPFSMLFTLMIILSFSGGV